MNRVFILLSINDKTCNVDLRFHQKLRVSKKARGFVNFDLLLDGEEAMRNLEAAQVKMEEKLNYMTNFIDQELQKVKENPVRAHCFTSTFVS